MITAETFKAFTGTAPQDDDLERCNCQHAGELGHWYCGWNHDTQKPAFYGGLDRDKVTAGYYRVKED